MPVDILRDGERRAMTVTIAELEEDKRAVKVSQSSVGSDLGITVEELAQSDLEQLGLDNGVLVKGVEAGSPAAESGLRPGDVLVSINREAVESAKQFESMASKLPREKSLPILVQRGDARTFMPLVIPDA